MTTRNKILFGVLGFYALGLILIFIIFGFTRRDNNEFQPQNEFKLDTWVNLPGPFDINKAVLYLVIAAILTCVTMIWISRRMQARPNRVQTAVEVLFSLMRDNITRGNLDDRMAKKYFPFIGSLFLGLYPVAGLSSLIMAGTGAGALIMLQRRRDVDADVYSRLWNGPLGRWLFRIARWVTPRGAMPAAFTHRPTELTIGLAADQLFEKLDKPTRKRLGDLPVTVRRLEADAQRMRARLETLQDALAETSDHSSERSERIRTELVAERDLVQKRLGDAVAALETIRLGLLRLHAGTATVQSLTTDLGLAAQVAKDVDRLLDGRREVERLLRPTPDPERA